MVTTVALAGLAITIGPLSVGQFATSNFGSAHIGNTVAFTAFALCLIAAAIECRSEIGTALTTAAFDSKQMNWAMLSEFALAVLVSQMNVFHRLLGTTDINLCQFGWALIPPIALLALWKLGQTHRQAIGSRRRPPRLAESGACPAGSQISSSAMPSGAGQVICAAAS